MILVKGTFFYHPCVNTSEFNNPLHGGWLLQGLFITLPQAKRQKCNPSIKTQATRITQLVLFLRHSSHDATPMRAGQRSVVLLALGFQHTMAANRCNRGHVRMRMQMLNVEIKKNARSERTSDFKVSFGLQKV